MVVKFTSIGSQVTKQEFKERRKKHIRKLQGFEIKSNAFICRNMTCPCFFLNWSTWKRNITPVFLLLFPLKRKKKNFWNQENLDVQMSQIVFFLNPHANSDKLSLNDG